MMPIIKLLNINSYSHHTHFPSQHLSWGLKSISPWPSHLMVLPFMEGVKSIKWLHSLWDWRKADHSTSLLFLGRKHCHVRKNNILQSLELQPLQSKSTGKPQDFSYINDNGRFFQSCYLFRRNAESLMSVYIKLSLEYFLKENWPLTCGFTDPVRSIINQKYLPWE